MIKTTKISSFEQQMLEMTVDLAEKAFENGNYPVGAVMTIDGKILASQENKIVTKKSWAQHAESQLIINNGEIIRKRAENKAEIVLYSSLEPCLMCLGTATMNKINKILFIQRDPHGGAGNLEIGNLGECYPRNFPEIIEARISERPKELIIKFLEKQLVDGNKTWARKVLTLFEKA